MKAIKNVKLNLRLGSLDVDRVYNYDAITGLRLLPNDCVQACCCSPPYFGPRDYKTKPLIWGGDRNCQHDWVTERTARPNQQGGSFDGMRSAGTAKATKIVDYKDRATYSKFCSKCGAWEGHLGWEPRLSMFTDHLVEIFREVRRVLRPDGNCWIVIGDNYVGGKGQSGTKGAEHQEGRYLRGESINRGYQTQGGFGQVRPTDNMRLMREDNLKPKDLCLVPFRLTIALQEDGWWVRQVNIWWKGNPEPSSAKDRTTTAHEYILHLTKSPRYFYNGDAIREPYKAPLDRWGGDICHGNKGKYNEGSPKSLYRQRDMRPNKFGRNKRSVWRANEPLGCLREDLTDGQKYFVISELIKRGLI